MKDTTILTMNVKLCKDDFEAFLKYTSRKSKFIWLGAFTIFITLICIKLFKHNKDDSLIFLSIIAMFVVLVLWFFLLLLMEKKMIRKQLATFDDNLALQEDQSYTINNKGINIKTANSTLHLNWEFISYIKEYGEGFVIHLHRDRFFIIPKKSFKNFRDLENFKKLYKNKCKK